MPTPTVTLTAPLRAAVERRRALGTWARAGDAEAALAAVEADLGPGPDGLTVELAEVVDLFGLSALDARLLGAALLAELHPCAHLLTGLLSGDDGPARPTVALALELAGASPADAAARARLAAAAPLRHTGLVDLDGDDVLLARRVRLPDRVAARLTGSPAAPPALVPLLVDPVPVDVDGTSAVAAALGAGEPLVWVHAPTGAAGVALAAAACRALDVTCLVGDLERVPSAPGTPLDPATLRAVVRALALEASLDGSVLVLAGAHLAGAALEEVARAVVPVVAVGAAPWDPRWAAALPPTVSAGRLTPAERADRWASLVDPDAVTREVLALRMTPEQIVAVAHRARRDAATEGRLPTADDVRRAARRLGAGGSSRTTHRERGDARATLDDLVLPPHTRREVERLVGWVRDRDEVLALGDLHGKGGKGTGITALFSGSPGTGKTLAAHVVADSLGVDLFQVDLSAVVDKYIGETEKNLERVFQQAEALNAVLFFDEADSLFGSRSSVSDARDRYANQEVAYLLQRMEASEGVTILATNLRGNLDPAFARRLHFMVHFPDPDEATRALLWQHHLAQLPGTDPDDPVDVAVLAAVLDLAGGDIRNIVLAAAYDAVAERRPVGHRDVRASAEREIAKLGRRIADPRW
jgi:hypothetical protein